MGSKSSKKRVSNCCDEYYAATAPNQHTLTMEL
jgi:hypothetical protein